MQTHTTNNPKMFKHWLWLVYGSLVFSISLYWPVLNIALDLEPITGIDPDTLTDLFGGIAAATVPIILFVRFRKIGRLLNYDSIATAPTDAERMRRASDLRFWYLLCYVLCESVAVYGVGFALITGIAERANPFILVSLALFALCFPRLPKTQPGRMSGPIG